MKFGVIVFPGSNCDYDCYYAIKSIVGEQVDFIWHKEEILNGYDCLILPGGFSYGDYLRTGAIARFSPIMSRIEQFAREGGSVMGICNGFQILLEMNLLPGAMRKNQNLSFICRYVYLRVENTDLVYTGLCRAGQVLKIPIAHFEGNYYADEKTLTGFQEYGGIVFRYCDKEGRVTEESNPNGSVEAIAGVCNPAGNVLGMMPHPERCCESLLGSPDGRIIFESIVANFQEGMMGRKR